MAREPFNEEWANNPDPDQFEKPPAGTFASGWVGGAQGQLPEAKWENWWHNRVDAAMQQIERYGVMDWHPDAIYGIGGRARGSDGKFYLSVATPNEGNDPTVDDETNWVEDQGSGQNIAVFETPGVTEWTVPAVLRIGYRRAYVTVIGGGGGGSRVASRAGGGGGGGGVGESIVDLAGVDTVAITVGAGGAGAPAGSGNANGSDGGTSSFGSFVTATGGKGGDSDGSGGSGGSSAGAQFNGGYGGGGASSGSSAPYTSGHGARGGRGVSSSSSVTGGGTGLPGGGGGGSVLAGAGGSGADGIVMVRW